MTRPTKIIPGISLTFAQIEALEFFKADGSLRRRDVLQGPHMHQAVSVATLRALERRGYCSVEVHFWNWTAHLTAQGAINRDRLVTAKKIRAPLSSMQLPPDQQPTATLQQPMMARPDAGVCTVPRWSVCRSVA